MKNLNGTYKLLAGLIISIVCITSIAVYKNELVAAYLAFGEQHPTILRVAVMVILGVIAATTYVRTKKK